MELRVGARGRVIGVISRARPWRSIASTAVLPWEAEADQHADDGHGDHHHGATGTASEPEVVYICDQLDEPQRFLAPCWLIPPADDRAHHSRRYWPASAHTLIPEIQLGRTGGRLVAHAVVMQSRQVRTAVPHGRDWRIRWSVATLPEFLAGERRVVESTELVLPIPGLYQLELHVEHIGTGAIRTAQRQVVARDA